MTQQGRFGATPVLDKLITRTISVQGPPVLVPVVYRLSAEGNLDAAGEWGYASNRLSFFLQDANGVQLPALGSLDLDSTMVTIQAGSYSVTTGITAYNQARNPFNTPITGTGRLTFPDGVVDGALLTGELLLDFGQTTSTTPAPVDTLVTLWAARRDFPARDLIAASAAGLITIKDTRYLVRRENQEWAAGDTFTDEEGTGRTVQGVSQVLGRRFLELLGRSIT